MAIKSGKKNPWPERNALLRSKVMQGSSWVNYGSNCSELLYNPEQSVMHCWRYMSYRSGKGNCQEMPNSPIVTNVASELWAKKINKLGKRNCFSCYRAYNVHRCCCGTKGCSVVFKAGFPHSANGASNFYHYFVFVWGFAFVFFACSLLCLFFFFSFSCLSWSIFTLANNHKHTHTPKPCV